MKRSTRLLQLLAILLFLPLMARAQSEAEHAFLWTQTGGMHDLGTITGARNSVANAISLSGEVVGSNSVGNDWTSFRWTSKAGMQGLPAFGTIDTSANAVNNSGEIVGDYYPNGTSSPAHAFIWTPADGLQDLGTLGGNMATAAAINRSGQVVGYSTTASGSIHGFLWTQSGEMQDLGAFIPGAVNDAGIMAGGLTAANGEDTAAVWNKGRISILCRGVALGINNRGQVVGLTSTVHTTQQAFIWNPGGGGVQLLPMLPGAVGSFAQGINNLGEVAGWSMTSDLFDQAFVWTQDGGTQNIGNLGGNDGAQAFAINDAGQVIGSSTIQ
jgi:probable HAF family extracellular repeat protein